MQKKEQVTKLLDEKTGLMECRVCGERHNAVMKPDAEGKFHPENWECINKCKLIHDDVKTEAHGKKK
jgi:hypothetical protein